MKVQSVRTGKVYDYRDIQAVEHLLDLKRKYSARSKGGAEQFWKVIDEIVKIWRDKNPTQWKSYLIELGKIRKTRRDEKFGESKKGSMRYLLDVPQPIIYMIRCLYDVHELPMNDKKFWREFGKRYTVFLVPKKV